MGTLIKQECSPNYLKRNSTFIATYCLYSTNGCSKVILLQNTMKFFTPQESFTSVYNVFLSWFAFY